MNKPLKNKAVLITGVGRLKGIGAATCLELAKRGADIFFTYWLPYDQFIFPESQSSEPEELMKQIKSLGVACQAFSLDLSTADAPYLLIEKAFTKFPHLSVLINNATYSVDSDLNTLDSKILDQSYRVNVRAPTLLCLEFAKKIDSSKGGSIINFSSGQSLGPMSSEIAYAITKGAIVTLTKTIYPDLAKKNITINALNPGPTDTGWMNEALQKDLLKRFPKGRIGLPQDAARLVAFLASDEANWITGQEIHSEGGFIR